MISSVHHIAIRRPALALAALALTTCWLALHAAPASTFVGYPSQPSTTFGEPGAGDGQLTGPAGVAVNDESGDVYVVDLGDNRVERFDAAGKYVSQFDGGEAPTGQLAGPYSVAVDNSAGAAKGDVYVTDVNHGVVDVFDAAGNYLSQIAGTPSSFEAELYGVAVDGSGNVWVYDGNGNVDEFSPGGAGFLSQFNTGRGTERGFAVDAGSDVYLLFGCGCVGKYTPTGSQLAAWGEAGAALAINQATGNVFLDRSSDIEEFGPFGEPYGVAIQAFGEDLSSRAMAVNDSTETVYVSEAEADRVAIFKRGLLADVTTGEASAVKRTSATLEGSVNPEGKATSYFFEYGQGGAYGSKTPVQSAGEGESAVPVTAELSGLATGTTYHYRLVAESASGVSVGVDATFATAEAVVGLLTLKATDVETTSATLNGSVEPDGEDVHYWFEYGTTPSLGTTTPVKDAGSGTGPQALQETLVGLRPSTTYSVRVAAEDSFGRKYGQLTKFTTREIPAVILEAPFSSAVSRTGATLHGSLNPENSNARYYFLYGPTSAYGYTTLSGTVTPSFEATAVAQQVSGLTPATSYHYALVVENEAGSQTSADETFTTAPPTPPAATTTDPTVLGASVASIAGTIDPHGLPTSYRFEIGTTSAYGTTIAADAGQGFGAESFALTLRVLAPETTYHYRISATNEDGTSYGADRSFTTAAFQFVFPPALPQLELGQIAFPAPVSAPVPRERSKTVKHKHRGHAKGKHRRKAKHNKKR